MSKKIHVMFVGLRGFPDVEGGVETHVQNLSYELVKLGCDVTVVCRSRYKQTISSQDLKSGIKFTRIWAPKGSGPEVIWHSFFSILYAAFKRPDILHIHAIGPALFTILAKFFRLNVVVTHHGPDYDRDKWGGVAKRMLKQGEKNAVSGSDKLIVISKHIENLIEAEYSRKSVLIPNGVHVLKSDSTNRVMDEFELTKDRFILHVGRFVKEKKHLDLIEAFNLCNLSGWKLVFAGKVDPSDAYTSKVLDAAKSNQNIVFTGFRNRTELSELYSNTGLFVLPSSHEGLSIAILEALSYGAVVVASNIPANMEVDLNADQYFELGNTNDLANKITMHAGRANSGKRRENLINEVSEKYSWAKIASDTLTVYQNLTSVTKYM